MEIRIQRADRRHLADINRLLADANMGGGLPELPGDFWFVRIDDRVVGCIGLEMIADRTAVLMHYVVDKPYRKRRIGVALLDHAMGTARRRGATRLALVTMYYNFNRFKRRGFRTCPRKLLPDAVRAHWRFTAQRYMKCAAMIRDYPS